MEIYQDPERRAKEDLKRVLQARRRPNCRTSVYRRRISGVDRPTQGYVR